MSNESPTTVLRLKPAQRWFLPGLLIASLLGVGAVISWIVWNNRPLAGGALALVITILSVTLVLLLTLGYGVLLNRSYRLEFDDTGVAFKIIPHPIVRPFHFTYSDIARVTRGNFRGVLALVPRTGQPRFFTAEAFEGGAVRLLAELERRLGAEKIDPDLVERIRAYAPGERRYMTIMWTSIGLMFAFMIPYFYSWMGHEWVRGQVAWQTVGSDQLFGSVQAFTIDSTGTPWAIRHEFNRESAQLERFADDGTQTWEVPLSESSLNGYRFPPEELAIDALGRPWVSYRYRDQLRFWNGAEWEVVVFPDGHTEVDSLLYLTAADDNLWATVTLTNTEEEVLLRIDPLTLAVSNVALPEAAQQADLRQWGLQVSPADDLLIYLKNSEQRWIYLYRQGAWQAPGYQLPLTAEDDVAGFTLDASGQLWVLVQHNRFAENETFLVGRHDPATGAWSWTHLPNCCGSGVFFHTLEIDQRGRLWVTGEARRVNGRFDYDYLAAFEPVWDGLAREQVRYSDKNSNYQSGRLSTELRQSADGYLWTANRTLVQLDARAAELPRPLPEWTITLFDYPGKLVWMVLFIIVQFFNLGVLFWFNRRLLARPRVAAAEPLS